MSLTHIHTLCIKDRYTKSNWNFGVTPKPIDKLTKNGTRGVVITSAK